MESAIAPASAQTLPAGPSVAAGAVSIATPSGTSVIIDQTSRNAVINWNSFSIGAGNSVAINNGAGATLNRVTGNIPSRIDGSLTATGSVYLVNPAGVAVGPGGKVLTGGSFTASTLDIPDAAFLNGGDKSFSGTSKATVTNAGSIGSLGGDVALIAREVTNTGTLTAPNGTVGLAAGYEVLVKDSAVEGGKFQVKVGGSDTAATTSGRIAAAAAEIRANGGNVYALAGNTGGVIAATGTASSGGRIFLTAGDGGTVEAGGTLAATRTTEAGAVEGGDIRVSGGKATVTGTLSARGSAGKGREEKGKGGKSAAGKGGTVAVTGTAVTVTATAMVDVSGSHGGAIAVGGDYQGGKDAARKTLKETVANAKTATVAAGARLSADGADGDGGSVVVWSDDHTDFAGTITARGTGAGGKGGDAEVSGKATLSFRGTADLTAASGAFGTLLLDPYNVTISAGSDSNISDLSGVFTAGGNDSVLSVATLNDALTRASVAVSTATGGSQAGTITVAAPVTWSSNAALMLAAAGDIVINAPITATGDSAGLTLQYGVGRDYTIASNASVTMSGSAPTLRIGKTGTLQDYQTISSLADLASIDSTGATGRYALVKNLDAAGTTYANALVSRTFDGTFAGLGNTISNLTVKAPGTDYVGLFATIGGSGVVRDLTLTGATLSGKGSVGALAGFNMGTITQAHVTGSVTGADDYVGVLAGFNLGTITLSDARGSVTGSGSDVGGLAGANTGTIDQSYATTAVTGSGSRIGGLAGLNTGIITQSYATGSVTGGNGPTGGFVGLNDGGGYIADAYTTASVTKGLSVGGFVGMNDGPDTTIARAYATGSIVGQGDIYTGGFVGIVAGGLISSAYWDTGTTGKNSSDGPVDGLTTAAAFSSASYSGFDFNNTWYMVDGYTRPFLRSEYSTVIGNAHQLQLMGMAPSAAYTLATDIDAGETGASSAAGMWRISGNRSGFAPVGDSQQSFTGSLDGRGHVIQGLTFASTDGGAKLGLFGVVGTAGSIRDIGLTDVAITGSGAQAGSLAGENNGTIVNAQAAGTVTGGTGVGGLVGRNTGTITQSHAAVTVTGDSNVGGLVGESETGTVNTVYATGAVHGSSSVGGLIGDSSADSVTKAYATGAVSGEATVGGLIGALRNGAGSLSESYATGAVTATDNKAGGLLGGVEDATVTNVYATGSVTGAIDASDGEHFVGGLVGDNYYGTITNAYATGLVTLAGTCTASDCKAGGLAGRNGEGSINTSYWDKGTTGQAGAAGTGNGAVNTVTGIETADAFSTATYGNFDLTNSWYLVDGQTRPFLRSEHATSIANAHQLQLMALDLSAAYTLAADVDAGETGGSNAAGMWSLSGIRHGFVPVGNSSTPFTGSLDGQGHVIQRLAIRPEDYSGTNQGLFGVIGAAGNVRDIGLTDLAITGAGYTVGGLAGQNDGTIANAYVTGSVQGSATGGLVGKNTGTISRSYVTATVSQPTVGGEEIGGLVSENTGTITQSYATGDVTGRSTVGGFAAKNSGTITQSYATGALTGTIGTDFGGFVGNNSGSISQSYATGGAVSGNMSVGGFVGMNTGAISQSYAAKAVSGSSMVGGFFGFSVDGTTITSSYFDTTVAGTAEHAGSASTVTGMTGLTTAQFQDTASFMTGASGWDFDSVWVPPSSGYYPVLYAMAPVTWVKTVSADTVYGSGSGTMTAIGTQSSLSSYIFGKAGDSLTLTGATIATDPTAAVSATPITASLPTSNATVTSAKGTDYRVFYYGNAALTVTPAALTVTADDATKSYGDAATLSGFTVTGLKNSDSVTGVSLSSTGAAATAGVGSYGITASSAQGSGLSNYTVSYTGGTLTVNPATLTVTADDLTKTYGDSATLTGYTATGLKNSDSVTGVSLSSTGTAASAGVGSYTIAASSAQGSGLSNYTVTYADGTLTVDPAALTVTADAARKTYGDSASLTGYTATGLKNSDSVSGVSLSSTGTAASAGVGSYTIAASSAQGSGLSNYTVTYADGTLTVDPAALTVTADAARKTYGDSASLTGYTATGLKNSDSVTGVSLSSTGTAASAGVGSYTIAASSAQGSGLANYTITYADGTLTVDPAALTVTADAARKTYGDSASLTGYTATGLKNSDSVTGVSLSSTGTAVTAGVGSYTIAASSAQGSGLSNYTVTYADGTLTVDPAALTVTADAARKTYGDSASLTDFIATGLKNSDSVSGVSLSSTGTAVTAGVGSYTIAASSAQGSGLANYTITYADGTLTVDPAALTVTADAARKTYGDSASLTDFTATGLKNSDSVTGVSLSSTGTAVTAGVGSYTIAASSAQGSGLANYTVTYADGTLTVDPAALTVTADAARKTYGDSASLTDFTATGLKNGDSVTGVSLSSTGAAATAGVGSYTIAAASAQGSGLSNYTVTYADGTLTVDPAALTVTADAARKTYGDSASLTDFTATGLKNSDSVSGVSLSSTGTAVTAGVGSYTIAASSAQGSGLANYTITYADGTLTVDPAALTVTADAARKTYGDSASLTDFTATGLKNSDSVTGVSLSSTGTAASAGVGSYTIAASSAQGSGLANYTITYADGTLTVDPAALTVTADAARKTYGDSASLTGYTATGLKNSDSVTGVSLSSTGTAVTAGVGSYTIAASSAQGSGLSNYTVTYADGTLTVDPAALTVTADAARKTYGDSASLTDFIATGLKNSDSVSGVSLSSTGTAVTAGVGSYTIAASSAQGSGLANYTITYADGTLTVDPAALTVTADAARKTYGDSASLTDFTATGLKNSDSVTGVSLSSTGTAVTAGVGSYTIAASSAQGSGLANYTVTYADGTLTVDPAALTVTADAARKTYGDSASLTDFTATGLKNGDSVTGVSLSSTGAAATAGVGSYTIAAASAQGSGLSNYTITYADGTLTVDPATLTVTADAARKTYGDSASLTDFTATGLKNSDSVTGVSLFSTGTAVTAGVGSYTIAASSAQGSGLSNYTITYVDGALTVAPRPILVAADSLSRPIGTGNPTLTYTVGGQGLVNGDTLGGALSTAAGIASPAGSYTIEQGMLAASSNYSLTFMPGVLTVTATGETVTPQPPSGPVQVEELTQVLAVAALPRNLVVVTASPTTQPFRNDDAPVSFPTAGPQAASGDTSAAADGASGGSSGGSGSQETAGGAAGCIGGAAASSDCTAAPHPENTRFGRFLRFSMP